MLISGAGQSLRRRRFKPVAMQVEDSMPLKVSDLLAFFGDRYQLSSAAGTSAAGLRDELTEIRS